MVGGFHKTLNFGLLAHFWDHICLKVSDIVFAFRSRKSLSCMYIKPPFLQLILRWVSKLLPQGQDIGRLHVFPTISDSCWISLDKSNPNSVIGSTVNQFKTPARVTYPQDVFLCHSFLSLSVQWCNCIFVLLIFLSQFWVSLYYLRSVL